MSSQSIGMTFIMNGTKNSSTELPSVLIQLRIEDLNENREDKEYNCED